MTNNLRGWGRENDIKLPQGRTNWGIHTNLVRSDSDLSVTWRKMPRSQIPYHWLFFQNLLCISWQNPSRLRRIQ